MVSSVFDAPLAIWAGASGVYGRGLHDLAEFPRDRIAARRRHLYCNEQSLQCSPSCAFRSPTTRHFPIARSDAHGGAGEWPANWAQPMFSGHDLDTVVAWRDGRDFQTLSQLVKVNPPTTGADILAWAL